MSRFGQRTRVSSQVSGWITGAAFTPASLAPRAWYDAAETSSITASSGAVSQWNDLSGNGYHLSQATAINQPITGANTINGLNVIRFDGSNDWIANTTLPASQTQPWSIFIVAKASSAVTTTRALMNPYSGDNGAGFLETATGVRYVSAYFGAVGRGPSITDTNTNVFFWLASGTSSIVGANTTFSTVSAGTLTRGAGLIIGSNLQRTSEFFNGDVAEIIFFNYALTTAQRDQCRAHLASKWGL